MRFWKYGKQGKFALVSLLCRLVQPQISRQALTFLAWKIPPASLFLKSFYLGNLRLGLNKANRVIFVCYGNKCRSPFAEYYLRQRLHQIGLEDIEALSAGYREKKRATSNESAVAARKFGIELQEHEPRGISEIEWRERDMIFVFDLRDVLFLASASLPRGIPIVPIGVFEKEGHIAVVEDPWGKRQENMMMTYSQIVRLLEGLIGRLRTRHSPQRFLHTTRA